MCGAYLNLLTNTDPLITMSNNDIQEPEKQILEFLDLLRKLSFSISEQCSAVVMPFICQYVYPPCDGDGSPLLVTEEQCINIRDDVCAQEWRIARTTELRPLLPICEEFGMEANFSSVERVRNISEPLKCHYQFDEYCGEFCLLSCGKFSQYPVQTKFAARGLIIFSCVLELIGGSIFLIASIIRRKEM